MGSDVPGSIMSIKVVYGSEASIENWYGVGEDGGTNIYITENRVHHIELDIATGKITVE